MDYSAAPHFAAACFLKVPRQQATTDHGEEGGREEIQRQTVGGKTDKVSTLHKSNPKT